MSYSIIDGNSSGAFALDESTGELTVADQSQLDYETNPEFVLTVEVSDDESTASAIVTVELTDEEEDALATKPEEVNLTVYPNPAKDRVVVEVDRKFIGAKATVVDMTGKIFKSVSLEASTVLDMQQLPAGIYLIKVGHGNETTTIRLTKVE